MAGSHLPRLEVFHLHPIALFDDLRNPLPVAMPVVALVAEKTDRTGLPDQRRQLVQFFSGLRCLQVLGVDLVQRVELAAARGLAALLWRAQLAQMQIRNASLVEPGGELIL